MRGVEFYVSEGKGNKEVCYCGSGREGEVDETANMISVVSFRQGNLEPKFSMKIRITATKA
jgi:hypothetical protein